MGGSLTKERKETAPFGHLAIGWWQILDLNHEHSHSHGRLRRKKQFSSSPAREAMLQALFWYPKLQPCCPFLFGGPTCIAAAKLHPIASGGFGVHTGHL